MRYRHDILERDGLLNYEAPDPGTSWIRRTTAGPRAHSRGSRAAAGEPWPPVPPAREGLFDGLLGPYGP
jgi:hypothetical protein